MKAKAKRPQRKRGKPMHVPTAQTIATVRAMCGVGYPQVVIARNIGISDVTLRAHYREVIDNAVESASINEAALGTVDAADKVRQSAFATMAHARAAAQEAARAAREAHASPTLSVIEKHAKAAEVSAKAILPAIDSLEKARKTYDAKLDELRKMLAIKSDASEQQLTEIRSKLAAMPQTMRYAKIAKNIDDGHDSVVAAVVSCDPFLADFVTEPERAALVEKWRAARWPQEHARLKELESDNGHLEMTATRLQSWQRTCFNSSISARDVQPATPYQQHGAPGPRPINRGAAPGLVERAAIMTAALARR
jgi:hypothetical protein